MKNAQMILLLVVSFFCFLATAKAQDKLFPPVDANDLPLSMPANTQITKDVHGNLLVGKQPRYFVGTQFVGGMRTEFRSLPGYDPQYNWLYNGPVDYEYTKRLGFDSVGFFMNQGWIRNHDPQLPLALCSPADEQYLIQTMHDVQIPMYIDFTCAPWSQGIFAKSPLIDPAAVNTAGHSSQGNHWVPYNILTPQGRALYRDMWTYGTQQVLESGGKPLFYELFNEPAYSEVSKINRQYFLGILKKQFANMTQLNRTWGSDYQSFEQVIKFRDPTDQPGLFVSWSKFLENAFTSLCQEGVTTIKQLDTRDDILFAVQSLGGNYARVVPSTHVNLYDISKIVNAILTPTSGGLRTLTHLKKSAPYVASAPNIPQGLAEGVLQRHFIRALAVEGSKPIFNGEAYGHGRKGIRNMYWLDMIRGCNAGYLFSWNKRAWDKLWKTPGGGKKLAEKFPYMMLNIHSNTTESLTGPMAFQHELAPVNDLMVRRENRPLARIAMLFSYPTERYSQATGSSAHHLIRNYTASLEFTHHALDVLLEEQLVTRDLSQYQVIVAAGTQNIYPQTHSYLDAFVKHGGVVIFGQETLAMDEYGQPLTWDVFKDLNLSQPTNHSVGILKLNMNQSSLILGDLKAKLHAAVQCGKAWKTLATLHQQPALLVKSYGKGKLYYLATHMPDYALGSLLSGVLQRESVMPQAMLARHEDGQLATNVELHVRKANGLTAYFMFNHDAYPKLINLSADALQSNGYAVVDPIGKMKFDIRDGKTTLLIKPEDRLLVVVGDAATLREKFGDVSSANMQVLEMQWAKLQPKKFDDAGQDAFEFDVDANKTSPLDLRAFVNRHFIDRVAGDGKGGWTDQGENSLIGVPWGLQSFLGVPFELIRFDENFDKTCIVLQSKRMSHVPDRVVGIPVKIQAKAIYFLTATAWTKKNVQAMSYVIHYDDGTQVTVPIVCGQQTHDWWVKRSIDPQADGKLAWMNTQKRGLFAYRWINPHPERRIKSLDIVSANNDPIPITVAITVEQP